MPELLEAGPCPIVSHDDMVKHLDVKQFARLFECLGDLNVFGRMHDIATRMVVGDDDSGGIGENCGTEHNVV